jgi:integrase
MVASVRLGLVGLSGDDDGKAAERKRKAAAELPAATVATWERLLRGLWLSGLRLGEAINLTWDDDTKLTVDLSGRRPMFRIRAAMEKGNRDRVLPMTPDFAAMLQDTPKAKRTGPVFPLLGVGGEPCHDFDWASRIVGRVGRAAGVKVNTADDGTVKYASAHDLRRSFGARWAPRVMPIVLQQLMRHESIDTTLRYYVGQDAESLADAVWAAAERAPGENVNTFVNSR